MGGFFHRGNAVCDSGLGGQKAFDEFLFSAPSLFFAMFLH